MYKSPLFIVMLFTTQLYAGPYVEVGLGVPLNPALGYTPDMYAIASAGYVHHFDNVVSLDLGLVHRSLTGSDTCNNNTCLGDNIVEAKIRLEF